jgi:hypothetical protein
MKRTVIGTLAAVFVGTALIAAQDAQRNPSATSSQQDKDKTVTYTGCLEAGSTPGTFVLSNATEVVGGGTAGTTMTPPSSQPRGTPPTTTPPQTSPANPPTGTPPTGTPPTGTNPATPPANPSTTMADQKGQSLILQGTPVGFDLATNLNHKIQVSGTIADVSVEPAPERGTPAMKSFTLRSAKSLADRCTGH